MVFILFGLVKLIWATKIWRVPARRATRDFEILRALLFLERNCLSIITQKLND